MSLSVKWGHQRVPRTKLHLLSWKQPQRRMLKKRHMLVQVQPQVLQTEMGT